MRLFTNEVIKDPPVGLLKKVLAAIEREKQWQAAKFKLVALILLFSGQVWLFILAWKNFQSQILQSEFWAYLRLISLDLKGVGAYWQELGLSLLQSMPITPLLMLFTLILFLTLSLKFLSKYSKATFNLWGAKRKAI